MKPSEYFEEEIGWITHPLLKEFTARYIDKFPPYFMIKAASSTGKYHSAWSNVKGSESEAGGLARHTKAVCYMVHALAESEMMTTDEHDAALVAALYHDSIKYGFNDEKHTNRAHEMMGALFFKRCLSNFGQELPMSESIYNAIAFHQGRWAIADPPKQFPEDFDKIGQLVHRADMVASRSGIEFSFFTEGSLFG